MPIPAPTPTPKDSPLSPPGFARAAKALRAKIRACAARSFAARQGRVTEDAPANEDAEPALLASRAVRRSAAGRVPGHL